MEPMSFISVFYISFENYIDVLFPKGKNKHIRIEWLRFKNLDLI